MGCYDTIIINCPKCNEEHYFQSKSGDCVLNNYSLENCPNDVLFDANRHSPYKCNCGLKLSIDIQTKSVISD